MFEANLKTLNDLTCKEQIYVIKGLKQPLLGRPAIKALSIISVSPSVGLTFSIQRTSKQVVSRSSGVLKGHPYKMEQDVLLSDELLEQERSATASDPDLKLIRNFLINGLTTKRSLRNGQLLSNLHLLETYSYRRRGDLKVSSGLHNVLTCEGGCGIIICFPGVLFGGRC
ncbi:hypothetical protein GE061_014069 [Apolygus lucorum]|uniref:Uncharacterized protein n=1 Tax=Apolygus lucorum TaxID=248454 RepID=A0A8S9XS95_APOLU|nr:hypothetical protein GE061_014069 [Apolygus lucorum]